MNIVQICLITLSLFHNLRTYKYKLSKFYHNFLNFNAEYRVCTKLCWGFVYHFNIKMYILMVELDEILSLYLV